MCVGTLYIGETAVCIALEQLINLVKHYYFLTSELPYNVYLIIDFYVAQFSIQISRALSFRAADVQLDIHNSFPSRHIQSPVHLPLSRN